MRGAWVSRIVRGLTESGIVSIGSGLCLLVLQCVLWIKDKEVAFFFLFCGVNVFFTGERKVVDVFESAREFFKDCVEQVPLYERFRQH